MKWMRYMNGLMTNQTVLSKYNITYVPDVLIIRNKDYSGALLQYSNYISGGIYLDMINSKAVGIRIYNPDQCTLDIIRDSKTKHIDQEILDCWDYVKESNYINKCRTFL